MSRWTSRGRRDERQLACATPRISALFRSDRRRRPRPPRIGSPTNRSTTSNTAWGCSSRLTCGDSFVRRTGAALSPTSIAMATTTRTSRSAWRSGRGRAQRSGPTSSSYCRSSSSPGTSSLLRWIREAIASSWTARQPGLACTCTFTIQPSSIFGCSAEVSMNSGLDWFEVEWGLSRGLPGQCKGR